MALSRRTLRALKHPHQPHTRAAGTAMQLLTGLLLALLLLLSPLAPAALVLVNSPSQHCPAVCPACQPAPRVRRAPCEASALAALVNVSGLLMRRPGFASPSSSPLPVPLSPPPMQRRPPPSCLSPSAACVRHAKRPIRRPPRSVPRGPQRPPPAQRSSGSGTVAVGLLGRGTGA